MRLKLKCGNCGRNIQIEGEEIPRMAWMECPNCKSKFQTPSNILNVDDEIAGFKIVRHLGSGAMGCVYLATQLSMQRKVALKVLPPELTHNEDEIEEFLREVRLLAKLDHPSIVKAFEAGKDPESGNYFLAMNFVDGRSLEEEIEREGPFSEKRALKVALKLTDSLEYAWGKHEILHRDIKPSNIMLRDPTHPVLLDMGISKIHGTQTGRTTQGMMLGTPHYMSPEQARDSSNVDFRTDIYALGCTIYYMLTGEVPYDAPDVLGVVSKHAFDDIPSPKERNPAVSGRCVKLLHRMMAKKPEDRFESWHAVGIDIKRVLKGNTTMARVPKIEDKHHGTKTDEKHTPRRTLPALGKPPPRYGASPIVWAGAFFLLLLTGIGVFLMVQIARNKDENRTSEFEPPSVILKDPAVTDKTLVKPPSRPRPSTPEPVANVKTLPNMGRDPFTFALWIRLDSSHGGFALMIPGKWIPQAKWFGVSDKGRVVYACNGNFVLTSKTPLKGGVWCHIAITSSGSRAKMYVNGKVVGETQFKPAPDPPGSKFRLGQGGRGKTPPLHAGIDCVRIYRCELPYGDIVADMLRSSPVPGKPLAAWWEFEGNGRDQSGNGNHLSIRGRAVIENNGKRSKGLRLEGGTDITVMEGGDQVPAKPGVSLLDFGKNPYTVSVWIRPRSSYGAFWSKCHPIRWTKNSKWFGIDKGVFRTHLNAKAVKSVVTNYHVKPDNQWKYFAATFSGSRLCLYVNGKKLAEGEWNNLPDPADSIFRLGHRKGSNIKPFIGEIDSMRVYRVQLSSSELQQDMGSSRPLPGKPMAAWWEFESNGKDSSGQGNELMGRGPFDFVSDGKYGKALRVKGWCDIMLKADAKRLW